MLVNIEESGRFISRILKTLYFGLSVPPYFMKKFYFVWVFIKIRSVSHPGYKMDHLSFHGGQAYIRHGWIVPVQHRLEIPDLIDHLGSKPRRQRIFPQVEILPLGTDPILQLLGESEARI